ncbi:HNH endonuclease [Micromonospora sp. NBC_00330]|uniref:phosphorothioated DNA-binding restriction endonuclease n=1 Tax=Micromonospora sp. NBC_00330 TaxID=2903585 RepID=UPI002E2AE4D0|nr:HNH endonuclease [Micromonospora sp. NBC_00330]
MAENVEQATAERNELLARIAALRLHQRDGRRSPHKPLLILLALGRLAATGSSAMTWHEAQLQLGSLIAEFGPASRTSRVQGAAYPFTRLRSDGFWVLDRDVPMDKVGPLAVEPVTGRFDAAVEHALSDDPELANSAARALVEGHFPDTIAPDVLRAVGLDPATVLHAAEPISELAGATERRRDPNWRKLIIQAWDRQCAFCGFDGQLYGATVGIDAAHVRWFALDGPDEPDNGLALCALHHKLFDRGVLGVDLDLRIHVSTTYTARTDAGRAIYDLHGRSLKARPGTAMPADEHLEWHRRWVFKALPLAA